MTTLGQTVRSGEFLNGFHPTIADCSLASLAGFARDLYKVVLPSECARINQWYTKFSTRPSARPPEYPLEFLALARGHREGLRNDRRKPKGVQSTAVVRDEAEREKSFLKN
jgi:glutathione S-transferase